MIEQEAGLTCQEFVELVTDYLEDTLSPVEGLRFQAHLETCDDCPLYLDQMRLTMKLIGTLTVNSIAPDTMEKLLMLFRNWKQPRQD